MSRVLLISNSGRPYLQFCRGTIVDFLGGIKRLSLITAAGFTDDDQYFANVRTALEPAGLTLDHMHTERQPLKLLEKSEAVFVGGGNTYRLLKRVREAGLLEPLRRRVLEGMPYLGWSAGSNLAGPTILTTNDWNVVGLNDFTALRLVPFNINPHYKETDPVMAPYSETRDMRIGEYHKANANTVLGIEEQTGVRVEGAKISVWGEGRVRRFEREQAPTDYREGQTIPLPAAMMEMPR